MEPGLTLNQALAEASRCLLCYDAPCAAGCPASTAPDVFIRKLRFRNLKGAAKVIKERNIMGGACAIVCPTASLCAQGCTAAGLDQPIRIGELQRFIVEHAWQTGFNPLVAAEPNGLRVAIVGAGPAGLACAAELAKAGFATVVFERRSAAGGMLQYGIPNHRMSHAFIERELEDIRALGVEFRFGSAVETQADVDKLRADGFAAVFVATGAWRCATLNVPHRDGTGLVDGMAFLVRAKDQPDAVGAELSGREVLVVGGGDTAMDAAVTARRAGARDVSIVYRRSFNEMPGSPVEKEHAMKAGVHFVILTQPVDYVITDGKVTGARVVRTRLGPPDDSGRRRPENLPDTEHTVAADLIIEAIGLTPDPSIRKLDALTIGDSERIVVDESQRASADLPLYAGGDAVRGPALVVQAVRDGKAAAAAIREGARSMTQYKRLETTFLGVHFENPVMLSSSPVSNTGEMVGRSFDAGFGGVVFKTIGAGKEKIIHPGPRMAGYDYHADRLVGLQNVEQISDRPMKDNLADLAYLKKNWPTKVIVSSIMGFTKQEWRDLAKASEDVGADMLELNFSCPHMTVEGSGMKVSHAQALVGEFTAEVKDATRLPVLAKLTPNITDITETAQFAKDGGADGFTAINTVQALSGIGLDDYTPRPNVAGKGAMSGYSGPAVKPIGLRCIAQLAQAENLGLPLSGCGGIENWIDAVEYLLVGSGTLQITTGVIHYGYRIIEDILEGMDFYLEERGVERLSDIVGKAVPNIVPTDQFDLASQGVADYDLDRCVGCGQCYVICQDAGGQCLTWDDSSRRPVMREDRCLGCMICSFVCPVASPPMIEYRVVPGKPEILPPVSR